MPMNNAELKARLYAICAIVLAAVQFDEINRWLASLWRGKTLGLTIAAISAFVSLGIFLFASWLPPGPGGDDAG
jgi:hypothetical protein